MHYQHIILLPILIMACGAGIADDRTDYNRRAAATDLATFRQLDRNGDGRLEAAETAGDLNLGPRFRDIDINRDGILTPEEMQRYVEQTYGIRTDA